MKIIFSKNKLIKIIKNEKNLGFVPTMGGIHLGHLSLINKSINQCNKTLVSIYVNQFQFNKKSDFKKYPRILKDDIKKIKRLKINLLYLPKTTDLYPSGHNKNITIDKFSKKLCGKYRPSHFKAVVDVIDRFIKIIKPKKIYFGEKDFQQFKIVDSFVKENHPETKVVSCKTIRDKNGAALSSRNFLLDKKDILTVSKIYKLILIEKKNLIKNKVSPKIIRNKILRLGVKKIDYLKLYDVNKLVKPFKQKSNYKVFIAYYINGVRLIDNI